MRPFDVFVVLLLAVVVVAVFFYKVIKRAIVDAQKEGAGRDE
jgi:hypothetical protein